MLRRSILVAVLLSLLASTTKAQYATDAFFTLDPASPSLVGGLTPADVLRVTDVGALQVYRSGASLGLQADFANGIFDFADALSFGYDIIASTPAGSILQFSVDRLSVGAQGTAVFLEGPSSPSRAGAEVFESRLNGTNDLFISAEELGLLPGATGDELSALGFRPSPLTYLSIDPFSASVLGGLIPGDILLSMGNGAAPTVFAAAALFGLGADDDIDALAVADSTNPGTLDPGIDRALFSLSPFSPLVISGQFSAADVLYTSFTGDFQVFASAGDLGLLPGDNVDALFSVPEPGTGVLFGIGLLTYVAVGRVRQRSSASRSNLRGKTGRSHN
jgi:hypothetical protein